MGQAGDNTLANNRPGSASEQRGQLMSHKAKVALTHKESLAKKSDVFQLALTSLPSRTVEGLTEDMASTVRLTVSWVRDTLRIKFGR